MLKMKLKVLNIFDAKISRHPAFIIAIIGGWRNAQITVKKENSACQNEYFGESVCFGWEKSLYITQLMRINIQKKEYKINFVVFCL